MFTQEEYYWAWSFYLLGVLVFMGCWWLLTAKIKWRGFRHVARIVMAVTILTPWYTEPSSEYLSPAWIICIIEGAFEGPEAFWRAGSPLLALISTTTVVASLVYLAFWFKDRRPVPRSEPTLGDDVSDETNKHSPEGISG